MATGTGTGPTATALVDTLQVTNISSQVIPLNVKKLVGSQIFSGSGVIQLQSKATVEAEDDRFDFSQVQQLRRLGLVTSVKFRRAVAAEGSGSTDITFP